RRSPRAVDTGRFVRTERMIFTMRRKIMRAVAGRAVRKHENRKSKPNVIIKSTMGGLEKAKFKDIRTQFWSSKPPEDATQSHDAARENLAAAPRAVNGQGRALDASSGPQRISEDAAHAHALLPARRLLDGLAHRARGIWRDLRGEAHRARQGRAE